MNGVLQGKSPQDADAYLHPVFQRLGLDDEPLDEVLIEHLIAVDLDVGDIGFEFMLVDRGEKLGKKLFFFC